MIKRNLRIVQFECLESRRLLAPTPELLADINFGPPDSKPTQITIVGDRHAFFVADSGRFDWGLYASDLNSRETVKLVDVQGNASDVGELVEFGDAVYFTMPSDEVGWELWKTDGTPEGTSVFVDLVEGAGSSSPWNLTAISDKLVFTTTLGLFATDGTPENTIRLTSRQSQQLTSVGDKIFFVDPTLDSATAHLWVTDGTVEGTHFLKEFNTSGSRRLSELTDLNGLLLFRGDGGAGGEELWRSDGTPEGTTLVKDIWIGGSSEPISLTSSGEEAFFLATTPEFGREIWRTDGKSDGTRLVADIAPGPLSGSYPRGLHATEEFLYFSYNNTLWGSDGTEVGTRQIYDVQPRDLSIIGGYPFFVVRGEGVWTTDGTTEGTRQVEVLGPLPAVVGSTLVFSAELNDMGSELWMLPNFDECPRELILRPISSNLYTASFPNRLTANKTTHREFFSLYGGQRMSTRVRTTDDLTVRLSIVDGNGQVLAMVDSEDANTAAIQGVLIPDTGTYLVQIDSMGQSVGTFDAEVEVNSVYDADAAGLPSNDTFETPQSLDAAMVTIGDGLEQVSVIGEGDSSDYFSISLQPDRPLSILAATESSPIAVEILDDSQRVIARLDVSENSFDTLQEFLRAEGGTYVLRVLNPSNGRYSLTLLRGGAWDTATNNTIVDAVSIAESEAAVGRILASQPTEGEPLGHSFQLVDGEGWQWELRFAYIVGPGKLSAAFTMDFQNGSTIVLEDNHREAVILPYQGPDDLVRSRKLFVPESHGYARVIDSISNPTSKPITATFSRDVDVLRMSESVWQPAAKQTDGELSVDDQWMVLDYDSRAAPRPETNPVTVVWGQPGNSSGLSTVELQEWRIDAATEFEIQPGQTIAQMYFIAKSNSLEMAVEKAEALTDLNMPGALDGLSHIERDTIANWDLPAGDVFEFEVAEGDVLSVSAEMPQTGDPDQPNTLQPNLSLRNSAGEVVVAGAFGQPQISYTAPGNDTIYATIHGGGTDGEFILRVDGATGESAAHVVSSVPANGEVVRRSPSSLSFTFDQSIDLTSLSASDVIVNGESANSISFIEGKTVYFELASPVSGEATVSIPAGAITDGRGQDVSAFRSTFTVNPDPAQVTPVGFANDDALIPGDHTIAFRFSEVIRGDMLRADSIRLSGHYQNSGAIREVTYDEETSILTISADLPEDAYTLTFPASATGMRTLAGVPLDGDGNGRPGGDFVLSFSTDTPLSPIDDLRPTWIAAAGAMQSQSTRILGTRDDVDGFEIDLPAGDLLGIAVATSGFSPGIRVLDAEEGTVLAETSIVGSKEHASLNYVNVSSASQTFRIEVYGDEAGSYRLQVGLRSAFEDEPVGLQTNDSIDAAEQLGSALTVIDAETNVHQATVFANADGGDDYYAVPHHPSSTYSIIATAINTGEIETLRILDEQGTELFVGVESPLFDQQISARWENTGDVFYVAIGGAGEYQLTIRENGAMERAINDDLLNSQPLSTTVLGDIRPPSTIFLIQEQREVDTLLVVDAATGRVARAGNAHTPQRNIGAAPSAVPGELFVQNLDQFFRLDTALGAVQGESNPQAKLLSALAYDAWGGILYGATAQRELFQLDPANGSVVRQLANPPEFISGLAFGEGQLFAVQEREGQALSAYDPISDSWRDVGDTGRRWSALAFDDATGQLYAVRGDQKLYRLDPRTAEVTEVGELSEEVEPGVFELTHGGSGLAVAPNTVDPTGNGYHASPSEDLYSFDLAPGADTLSLFVRPLDSLTLRVELLDEVGDVLVESVSNGPHRSITLDVPASNSDEPVVRFVRLTAMDNSSGRYVLEQRQTEPEIDRARVLNVTPHPLKLAEAPTSLTLEFSKPLLATSINKDILTVSGVSAVGFELLEGGKVRFDLPNLLPGGYDLAIGDDLRDAFGEMVEPWTSEMSVVPEQVGPRSTWMVRGSLSGSVSASSSTQVFVPNDHAQVVDLSLRPDESLAPHIRVFDPQDELVFEFQTAAGQSLTQSLQLEIAGVYTFHVSGDSDSTGQFDISLLFGGSLEREGSEANDKAQLLDPLFADSPRVGILGRGDGRRVFESSRRDVVGEVFHHDFQFSGMPKSAIGGAEVRIDGRGISTTGNYRLAFDDKFAREFRYEITDGRRPREGFYSFALSQTEIDAVLADGSFTVTLTNADDGWIAQDGGHVQLSIKLGSLGETYDQYSMTLNPGEVLRVAVDDVAAETPHLPTPIEEIINAADAGTQLPLSPEFSLWGPTTTITLRDENGNVVATGTPSSEYDEVVEFTVVQTGKYTIQVRAVDEYAMLVTKDAVLDLEPNGESSPQVIGLDSIAFGGISETGTLYYLHTDKVYALGQEDAGWHLVEESLDHLAITRLRGRKNIDPATGWRYVMSDSRNLVAWDVRTNTEVDQLPPSPILMNNLALSPRGIYVIGSSENDGEVLSFFDFESRQWDIIGNVPNVAGAHRIQYDPTTNLLYAWTIFEDKLFQFDPATATRTTIGTIPFTSGTDAWFVTDEVDPSSIAPAILEPADYFQLSVRSGDDVVIETWTPDLPENEIDPQLELRRQDGSLLASDANGANDGRNAKITFQADRDDVLQIVVSSENHRPGAYAINVLDRTNRPAVDLDNFGITYRIDSVQALRLEFSRPVQVDPQAIRIVDHLGQALDLTATSIETEGTRVNVDLSGVTMAAGRFMALVDGRFVTDSAGASMASDLVIGPFSVAAPGDSNLDGRVDFADFLILSQNFGSSKTAWQSGDFDGNGEVEFADFLLLAANFGYSGPRYASLPGDADADGAVDFADFLVLSQNFGRNGSWFDGEFGGNGIVDFEDFLSLSREFGATSVFEISEAFSDSDNWWMIQ